MNIANMITAFRILGTVAMMGLKPFSKVFFTVYTLCGISDVLDGLVARKTNTVSEFGSKLDSVADLFFYFVMICKILPAVYDSLPFTIWYFTFAVIVVKITLYVVHTVKNRTFMSNHTIMNKITGFCVFLIPYLFRLTNIAAEFCIVTCVISIVASVEEFLHKVRR